MVTVCSGFVFHTGTGWVSWEVANVQNERRRIYSPFAPFAGSTPDLHPTNNERVIIARQQPLY